MPEAASRHQVQIGATTVTYLPDGVVHADPVALFPATTAQDWASHRHLLDANGWLVASVGSFLVRNDSGAALIDLGLGRIDLEVRGVATYRGHRAGPADSPRTAVPGCRILRCALTRPRHPKGPGPGSYPRPHQSADHRSGV
jgi:hypothetical protein